jgi:hypothetical protein
LIAYDGSGPVDQECQQIRGSRVKVNPYHTNWLDYPPTHRDVYHDHDDCEYGRHITLQHRIPGMGGRPRCEQCEKLG